jgi:hypothetical protein
MAKPFASALEATNRSACSCAVEEHRNPSDRSRLRLVRVDDGGPEPLERAHQTEDHQRVARRDGPPEPGDGHRLHAQGPDDVAHVPFSGRDRACEERGREGGRIGAGREPGHVLRGPADVQAVDDADDAEPRRRGGAEGAHPASRVRRSSAT